MLPSPNIPENTIGTVGVTQRIAYAGGKGLIDRWILTNPVDLSVRSAQRL